MDAICDYCSLPFNEHTLQEILPITEIKCFVCKKISNLKCIDLVKSWKKSPLIFDNLYKLTCHKCSSTNKTCLERLNLSWNDVLVLTLLNLSKLSKPKKFSADGKLTFFHVKQDICEFIEKNWCIIWTRQKHSTWKNSCASCLSTNASFVSGSEFFPDQGLWALRNPGQKLESKQRHTSHQISPDGTLIDNSGDNDKKSDFSKKRSTFENDLSQLHQKKKYKKSKHSKPQRDYSPIEDNNSSDSEKEMQTLKSSEDLKGDFITMYPDIPNPYGEIVHMSDQPTHTAPKIKIINNSTVSSTKGYKMAKASHGVIEGDWIGWSQISGDLQAPCGYDQFSYSWRQKPGTLFHNSDGVDKEGYVSGFDVGDTIGVLISLPSLTSDEKKDLKQRLWNGQQIYDTFKKRELKLLKGSFIQFLKNGKELNFGSFGFKDLNLGKYHPAVSIFTPSGKDEGVIKVNFGPDFKYNVPLGFTGFCEVENVKNDEKENFQKFNTYRNGNVMADSKIKVELKTELVNLNEFIYESNMQQNPSTELPNDEDVKHPPPLNSSLEIEFKLSKNSNTKNFESASIETSIDKNDPIENTIMLQDTVNSVLEN
ncbi:Set1/Ash2 histone methyltransferase complex subunit ASH2 [Clydaea vesicula]|uniref:Set1/Ash2 histone methyltransferase complex subunit ASH2 n=1 Tax=Clydaea vesicula TaxID=447962 RepID=A0AAD5TZE1_9FUNG|nr:Set1/Ash2 histone methyltransferase complex subunit ASH2 [Clydaea vesicula]